MGLVVRKSITIAKGVRLNMGLGGASVSFGTKGLRQTIHTSGRRTTTVGIPGTGVYYRTSSGGGKSRNLSLAQNQQQQKRANQQLANSEKVEQYNEYVNALKSIHVQCDDPIDWKQISKSKEPYNPAGIGPRETQAKARYDTYKPSFFEKISKSKAEQKQKELSVAIEQAAREDNSEYEEWQNLIILSNQVLSGDIDSYFQVIYEMNPLEDLLEYGSDFEFGANDGKVMEVEFRVKSRDIIPSHISSLTPTGRLSKKEMTKTAHYDLVQDYVCSCALRIARDMFALLPLEKVIVHAVDHVIDSATGRAEEVTILSVVYDRGTIEKWICGI
jgi:hypothetical protein